MFIPLKLSISYRISLVLIFLSIYQYPVYSQPKHLSPFQTPKPLYKDGKFIFRYNTVRDTFYNAKKKSEPTQIQSLSFNTNTGGGNSHTLRVNGPLVLNIITTEPTCGYGSGSIIVQATNGTAPYTYSLTQNPYNYTVTQVTGNFPVEGAGSYTITVTDALGATGTANITLTDILPGPVGLSYSWKNPTNCTTADGSFVVTGLGGTPPYTYSMDLIHFQSSNVFNNLYAGYYNIYVKDANGCIGNNTALESVCFGNPCSNAGYGLRTSYYACGNSGTIEVTTSELTGNGGPICSPFTFSIDGINFSSNGVFNNLSPGVYNIYLKNNAGQIVTIFGYNIAEFCEITIDYIAVDAACQQNDGILTINASNGTAPYEYTIDGINYQSSNIFTGLAPGNYFVTVRDNAGIKTSKPVTVYDRCPIVRTAVSGETCAKNDGIITAGGFKGTTPYQFSIDGINFQSNNTFGGLKAGNYTITIKDALGFTGTTTAVVPYNCLQVNGTPVNSTCGNANGSITATGQLGTPPYQFSIDGINFQSNTIFTNLAAGNYTLSIKDATGLTSTSSVTVNNTPGTQVNINVNPASCADNDGSVLITATGGTAPFQYSMDGVNYGSNNGFANIASGTTVTGYIKDGNGCITSNTATITKDCPTISNSLQDETCNGSNGSITVTGANGIAPYSYSIDNTNFQTSNLFNGLKAGDYTLAIKDAIGHINTATVTLKNICPTVTAIGTNGYCGTANASITATGANSNGPYQYSIDGINFQAGNLFNNLPDGTYTITVKDAAGLMNTTNVTVVNFPSPKIVSVNNQSAGCLNNDGIIQINATGGTSPLQYSIDGSNYQGNSIFNTVASGIYNCAVKDANGCKTMQGVTVAQTDNLTLTMNGNKTICEGKDIMISGNSNGNNFSWSPTTGLSDPSIIQPFASPAITTQYYLTAQLGTCTATDSLTVYVNPAPVANAGSDITVCYGQSTQLNGSGGISYEWTPSLYLNNRSINEPIVNKPTTTTTYSLVVSNANGCPSIQPSTVTVTVTPMAVVFAGNDTSIAIGEPLPLHAIDINNSGFSQYTWSPSYGLNTITTANPIATLDKDINYVVTATTPEGCEGSDDIHIKVFKMPEIYVPTAFTPNGDGKNDVLKAIPVGIKEFKYFAVYNRWGQQVFYTNDANKGWDGRINGIEEGTSVLTWITEGKDFKGNIIQRKGTVLLIR